MEKQKGSVIIFALLMTMVMLAIGLVLNQIFIPKVRIISESIDSVSAIFSADSAIEWCLYTNREKTPASTQPNMTNGATYKIYYNPESDTESLCPPTETPLNHRAVGTYKGVSRSFEVSVPTPIPTP